MKKNLIRDLFIFIIASFAFTGCSLDNYDTNTVIDGVNLEGYWAELDCKPTYWRSYSYPSYGGVTNIMEIRVEEDEVFEDRWVSYGYPHLMDNLNYVYLNGKLFEDDCEEIKLSYDPSNIEVSIHDDGIYDDDELVAKIEISDKDHIYLTEPGEEKREFFRVKQIAGDDLEDQTKVNLTVDGVNLVGTWAVLSIDQESSEDSYPYVGDIVEIIKVSDTGRWDTYGDNMYYRYNNGVVNGPEEDFYKVADDKAHYIDGRLTFSLQPKSGIYNSYYTLKVDGENHIIFTPHSDDPLIEERFDEDYIWEFVRVEKFTE